MAKSPEQTKEKWKRNMRESTADIRAGVERVTEAPGVAAANSQSRMRERLIQSIDSGKWARNVSSVSLADWKAAFISKGLPRITQGVEAADNKVLRFHQQLAAHQSSYLDRINSMPNVTLEDAEQRMIANMREMSNFEFDKSR